MMILQTTRGVLASGQFDNSARSYIAAVEAADGETLEPAVRLAINSFVRGCKTDGIWDAIKASCILAGARTLSGALVPLRGTAPTNFNFVSADYNRKTGLAGNGSTKYLNSNRNNNADPQDNKSLGFWTTQFGSVAGVSLGAGANIIGSTTIGSLSASTRHNNATIVSGELNGYTGFSGITRNNSSKYIRRVNNSNSTITQQSQNPYDKTYTVYSSITASALAFSDNRLSFYYIGEHLDLAKIDSRVSTLMSSLSSAIP